MNTIQEKKMFDKNNKINYVEFPARNLEEIKTFYEEAFGWKFQDFGNEYTAFSNSGLEGGFYLSKDKIVSGALVVLYHTNLEVALEKIVQCKGTISQKIFSFPGGSRFHFLDPSGNELAVWSNK